MNILASQSFSLGVLKKSIHNTEMNSIMV